VSEDEYKPRGGALLVALFLLAISLPAIGIFGMAYFGLFELSPSLTDKFLNQLGWMLLLALLVPAYSVAKKVLIIIGIKKARNGI
jgi:hypothetical protein